MRRILLYVLYTLLSTSCSTFSGIPEIIIHAEELMPQNPDSALFLLGSLNTGNINSQKSARNMPLFILRHSIKIILTRQMIH